MTRFTLGLLTRLGHGRGSAVPSSSALLDGLDSAAAASEQCSTSFTPIAWGPSRACAGIPSQSRRFAYRYNFIQPVDTNHITALLESATLLEHAAIPVLQYGEWFDPEQVTRTLQRVPRMLRYQRRKGSNATATDTTVTSWRLLDALGSRLAQVAHDCTDEQLARALWAFGVSRRHHAGVVVAACEQLPRRLGSMTMTQLATAAWGLAAATDRAPKPAQEPVQQALQAVARHLVVSRPTSLTPLPPQATSRTPPSRGSSATRTLAGAAAGGGAATASSSLMQPAADVVAAAAGRSALEADQPWMSHRSALKLAWAFAALDVRDPQALDVIGDSAAARVASQLQAHDTSSGPLSPRATYLYRTLRGWQAWPRPRPPRTSTAGRRSRYLRDERPRVVLQDFTLGSLGPLLASFRRLEHRHEGLLQASAQHVVASAGPALRVRPTDLTRVLGALDAFHFRHPAALAALLSCTQLADLPAPVLARLTVLAAEWGVTRKALYGRLARQLVGRAWVTGDADAGADASRAGVRAGAFAAAKDLAHVLDGEAGAALGREEEVVLERSARASWERSSGGLSWRCDPAILEAEAEQWITAGRHPVDRCETAEVARALLALAKVGYSDPSCPFAPSLVAIIWPHLTGVPADSVADLALAAVHYSDQLDNSLSHKAPATLDLLRDATNVVLYGTTTGVSANKPDRRRRLLALAGYSGGAASLAAANTDAQAAELRKELGLSAGGALRLALALTSRPEAVLEKELRAALSLVDVTSTSRRQLSELVQRMAQRGRNGQLPPRLLAAVGEGRTPGDEN